MYNDSIIFYVFSFILGAHAPSKPDVIVRGRKEMHVTWKPPEVPLGRINRYDLTMNGECVYSGMELHYTLHRLKPDKEYVFVVSQTPSTSLLLII